ncbi:hypothetical protein CC117_13875 [Parafrankia colletiae]|uniref:Carotenoid biosynthesis protein n=1 Tax=Parafrankia colletiae TaxID=573497 RepID=A0A1S1R2Y3_9ACTN|nr:carotenoid biosynthesis protein [Frankia sp. Cpl3]OHV40256.1 hypothetical protein CC117_13875 [Parafrankia colletiae]
MRTHPDRGCGADEGRAGTSARYVLCWVLAGFWVVVSVVSWVPAVPTPSTTLDALGLFALLGFVVVHASLAVGWRGFAVYVATSYIVALAFEATSIAVGFPFGYYVHHTEGPRLFDVPVVVPLGYVVYGWLAWSLAGLITRAGSQAGSRAHRVVTPVVAAFILAGWDFGYDAIGSTVRDLYTYRDPSGFMGVPLSNFLGWLLTGWAVFQLFALVADRFTPPTAAGAVAATARREYRLWPCAIWALIPVQYLTDFASAPDTTVERGGHTFAVADVYEASATAAILTMLVTAVIAGSHAWPQPGADEPAEKASQQPP